MTKQFSGPARKHVQAFSKLSNAKPVIHDESVLCQY